MKLWIDGANGWSLKNRIGYGINKLLSEMWFLRVFWERLIRNCLPSVGGLKYWTEVVIKSSSSWISFIDHFRLFSFFLRFLRSLIYFDYLYCIIIEAWMNGVWNFENEWIDTTIKIIFFSSFFIPSKFPKFLIGRSFSQERGKFRFWWIGTLIVLE